MKPANERTAGRRTKVTEDYFFACQKQFLEHEPMKRVLAIMRGEEFRTAIKQLPGYRIKEAGTVKTVNEVFRQSK
jgi:hypothetical protein